jgi:hypothetical protein
MCGVHLRDPQVGGRGQVPEPPGRRVPIHPAAARVSQDWAVIPLVVGSINRPSHRRRQRDENDLAALATNLEHLVAVFLTEVGDVRAARFEDPQSEQAGHGDQGEIVDVDRQSDGGDHGFELEVAEAEGG